MSPAKEFKLHNAQSGSALAVRIIPKSAVDKISGIMDDGRVKIQLKEALVDGNANQALMLFLSKALGIAKTSIEIAAGENNQDKLVVIIGLDSESLQKKITALVQKI